MKTFVFWLQTIFGFTLERKWTVVWRQGRLAPSLCKCSFYWTSNIPMCTPSSISKIYLTIDCSLGKSEVFGREWGRRSGADLFPVSSMRNQGGRRLSHWIWHATLVMRRHACLLSPADWVRIVPCDQISCSHFLNAVIILTHHLKGDGPLWWEGLTLRRRGSWPYHVNSQEQGEMHALLRCFPPLFLFI